MDESLFQLSPDCWFVIFGYLKLHDQVRLFRSFKALSAVVTNYWQWKCKCVEINFMALGNKEFHIFVKAMCRKLEVIKLKFMPLEAFQSLVRFEFPKVHDFRFSQLAFKLTDDAVLEVARAFPNLKTFSPQGMFTGKHMWELKHLESLTLTHCHKIDMQHVVQTLSDTSIKSLRLGCMQTLNDALLHKTVHFSKLERICLSIFEWEWLCRGSFMPCNLKELTLTEDSVDVGASVIEMLGPEKIVGVHFPHELKHELIHALPHLRTVSMTSCSNAIVRALSLVDGCKDLVEMNIYNCEIRLGCHITNLLLASTNLNRINFEDCAMDFEVLNIDVAAVVKKRTKPLTFNFYRNYHDEKFVELACSGESHLFRVTSRKTDVERRSAYLQFTLK